MMPDKLRRSMRNTARNSAVLLIVLLLAGTASAQLFKKELKLPESKLRVVKTGPFLGVEKGKYLNLSFGMERQWQQLKLIRPQTHAANFQLDFNFKYQTMGGQLGYWFKIGRLNLTYGARVSWRTDYTYHRFGISPNIGYKFMQAHLQMGVHLMPPDEHFKEVNTFYASLRWVFINERKFRK
jgi:hypothetical protein